MQNGVEKQVTKQLDDMKKAMIDQNNKLRGQFESEDTTLVTTWSKKQKVRYQKRPQTDDKNNIVTDKNVAETNSNDDDIKHEFVSGSVRLKNSTSDRFVDRMISRDVRFHDNETISKYNEEMIALDKQKEELRQKAQEKKNAVSRFLNVDDWMFFSKFIVIKNYEDYSRKIRDKITISEITGVYIVANITKFKIYVGYGSKIIAKCGQHFRRRLNSYDSVPAIREDLLLDDIMCVNFVKLKDTDFDTVKELADYYMKRYDSYAPRGYNK